MTFGFNPATLKAGAGFLGRVMGLLGGQQGAVLNDAGQDISAAFGAETASPGPSKHSAAAQAMFNQVMGGSPVPSVRRGFGFSIGRR